MTFTQKVLQVVGKIPTGQVMTYKQVAKKAGNEKASRAVGMIMKKNTNENIPCHRVIKSDGQVCGYNGLRTNNKKNFDNLDFVNAKREILKEEGVKFTNSGKVIF